LLAAAEEERFRRIKQCAGFPSQAIRYCRQEAKVDLADVTHLAVNRNSRANFLFRKRKYVNAPSPRCSLSASADQLRTFSGRSFSAPLSPNQKECQFCEPWLIDGPLLIVMCAYCGLRRRTCFVLSTDQDLKRARND
jgi:predicted NodU family carbamoyl transferase